MSDYNDYGKHTPWEPEDKYEAPNGIEPIYQQLLGHLASATKLAMNTPGSGVGRHVPFVEKARKLVKEASIHSASFLPSRANKSLNDAIDTLSPVSWSVGRDTREGQEYSRDLDRNHPAVKFHMHISDFVLKAHKQAGGALPGEEGWDR